jgi:ribonuclease-3
MSAMEKDPKTELQEWLQGRKMGLPTYSVVSTAGAAHAQSFVVACEAMDVRFIAQGGGTSRRAAEQTAASAMLEHLKTLKKK